MAAERILRQFLLHQGREPVETLAHVGAPNRQPHAGSRRQRDHRRSNTLMMRSSAAASTLASTTMRQPLSSTISMRPQSTAPNGGRRDPLTTTGANARSNDREPAGAAMWLARTALRQAKTW